VASQAVKIAAVSVRNIVDDNDTNIALCDRNIFLSSSHRHHSGQTKKFFCHCIFSNQAHDIFFHH
jgi:hypothetical protein